MKRRSLFAYTLFDGRCECIHLTQVNPGLNTFCRRNSQERKLNALVVYLDTSLAWRTEGFYATVTDCYGPQCHGFMFQSR